jgi:hypothetical protein
MVYYVIFSLEFVDGENEEKKEHKMINMSKGILINYKINLLREKLNQLLFIEPMGSDQVMELSEELDRLIARFYNQKGEYEN